VVYRIIGNGSELSAFPRIAGRQTPHVPENQYLVYHNGDSHLLGLLGVTFIRDNDAMEFANTTGLMERFGDWSHTEGLSRFWGVGKTGGRVCLVLPTLSKDFRSIIVEEAGYLWFIDGYASEPLENQQNNLGEAETTSPGKALNNIAELCLLLAWESLQAGRFDESAQRAHVAARIGHYTHDDILSERASIIEEVALSQ